MRPPRAAVWLLERCLPKEQAEAILGDLLESWELASPRPSSLWFWRETMAALVHHNDLLSRRRAPATTRRRGGSKRLDPWRNEVRSAIRLALARPAFSLFVILVVALGIGANSTLFGVVDAWLFRGLPFPDLERLVVVKEQNLERGIDGSNVSYPNYRDLVERSGLFEAAGVATPTTRNWTGPEAPARLEAVAVSPGYLAVFGIDPLIGRGVAAADQSLGAPPVLVLSEAFWSEHFQRDPAVLGRVLVLDGEPHTVVGVMPPHALHRDAQIWLPLTRSPVVEARTNHFLTMAARLVPRTSLDTAEARFASIAETLEAEHPDSNRGWGVRVIGLREDRFASTRPLVLLLSAALGAVLLLVCANVSGLLLARAATRERELALRLALGASRARVTLQILLEALLLCLVGGAAGALVGVFATRAIGAWLPQALPGERYSPSLGVLAATLALSLLAALLSGLAPALVGVRTSLSRFLAGGTSAHGRRATRLRRVLVVGQVALALVLVSLASIFVIGLLRLERTDPGFDPRALLVMQLDLPTSRYADVEARAAGLRRFVEEVSALPGVEAAGTASHAPLGGSTVFRGLVAFGEPVPPPEETRYAQYTVLGPGFRAALGWPLLAGRDVEHSDGANAAPVALLNETAARQLFGDRNPIGERVWVHTDEPEPRTVVGVLADARTRGLDRPAPPGVFVPAGQFNWGRQWLAVRSRRPAAELIAAVRARIAAVDPTQPVYNVHAMSDLIETELAIPRALSAVLLAFGAMALLLAAAGLHALLATVTRQRWRELGIRMALGASARDVRRTVLRSGALLVTAGALLGGGATLVVVRLLMNGPVAVSPLAVVPAVVLVLPASVLACLGPALRAARLDPHDALRE